MNINIGTQIELNRLIETRLLVQANSGAGKSWLIRKLCEEANGKVQQILLDLEGEFFSLREKYDFVVFGSEGDYPVHIKYADKVARTLLELNVSAIIDLYELKHHERILFVKRFLDSMINAPKELWHPCLVIIDEAHIFAPEKGSAESQASVIDLCTRGRKRGFCAVLATQRLSKLHKDAAAECNNKLIGRTGLDIDMKRAGDELGFNNKADIHSLRELGAGEFYAFGPAISNSVTKIKVGMVKTSHPKSGARLMAVPSPSAKIKKILSEFKDLPQEAEKELQSIADYKKEIQSLRIQLGQVKKQQPVQKVDLTKFTDSINYLQNENNKLKQYARDYEKAIARSQDKFNKIGQIVNLTEIQKGRLIGGTTEIVIPKNVITKTQEEDILPFNLPLLEPFIRKEPTANNSDGEIKLRQGARRMLAALVQWSPNGMTEGQMRSHAGLKNSGTYSAYKTDLKKFNFLAIRGDGLFYATREAIQWLGHDIPSPATTEDVLAVWNPKLRLGARRMLEVLISYQGEAITDEQLQQESGLSNSGTYSAYKTELKTAQLAIIEKGTVRANKETLFL